MRCLRASRRTRGPVEPENRHPRRDLAKSLPDVKTMIDRLSARLETTPDDIKGWRMLGWSYFHTGLYEQAAIAYAKALELDPNSAEIKLSHEEAKAKASKDRQARLCKRRPSATVATVHVATKSEAMPPRAYDAAIRSMVDGLADRLEQFSARRRGLDAPYALSSCAW